MIFKKNKDDVNVFKDQVESGGTVVLTELSKTQSLWKICK